MGAPKVFESEYRFCLIVWENEPETCANLAKISKERLGWSRTTTYTVVARLCERGILKKEGSVVSALYSKEDIQISEMDELIDKKFEGSVPAFVAAFAKSKKISDKDREEIMALLGE
ncbi:MAG: BlaI/MecI/CopY family transcriptional regulator [Clostridia bacterium]|nr:BlaI/MecI/CopY family transcriptional regulator [Clostridia bacterium]